MHDVITPDDEKRNDVVKMYQSGESIMSIHKNTGISRTTIYDWIGKHNANKKKPLNMSDYHKLEFHCKKLEDTISILKHSGCTVNSPLEVKYEVIKSMSDLYSISTLCAALDVAKGSYYNHIFRNKNGNTLAAKRIAELTPVVEEIYNNSRQIYGAGKIADEVSQVLIENNIDFDEIKLCIAYRDTKSNYFAKIENTFIYNL